MKQYNELESRYQKEIERIQSGVPKELTDRLMKKESKFETTKQVLDLALEDPDVPEEKKIVYRAIKASGSLDVEHDVLDFSVEKEIAAYYKREFRRARQLGRLPPLGFFPRMIELLEIKFEKIWKKFKKS